MRFGEFTVDRERFELRRGAEVIYLQPKTFDVLAYLLEHPGRVVKEDLVAAVWPGVIVTDHSLTRCIKDLRKALGDDAAHPTYIETVARRGYRFLASPHPDGAPEPDPRPAPAPLASRASRVARLAFAGVAAILVLAGLADFTARGSPPPSGTASLDAFQDFRIGLELLNRRPDGWSIQARAAFDRAIARDPDFAGAHAGRAIVLAIGDSARPREAARDARASAARAIALDPRSGLALAARGFLAFDDGHPAEAEALLRRAIARDPTLALAYNWLSSAIYRQGRRTEALRVLEDGVRIDPLHPSLLANIGLHYARLARFEDARRSYLRLEQLPHRPMMAPWSRVDLAMAQGRLAEALEEAMRWEAGASENARGVASLRIALALARLGVREPARARVHAAVDAASGSGLQAAAGVFAVLGDREAMRSLAARTAVGERPPRLDALLARDEILAGTAGGATQRLGEALANLPRHLAFGWGTDETVIDLHLALAYGLQRDGHAHKARLELGHLMGAYDEAAAHGLAQTPGEMALRAQALGLLGRSDEALSVLALAVDRGWNDVFRAAADPRWEALRGDARFRAEMAKASESVERERRLALPMLASAEDHRKIIESRRAGR